MTLMQNGLFSMSFYFAIFIKQTLQVLKFVDSKIKQFYISSSSIFIDITNQLTHDSQCPANSDTIVVCVCYQYFNINLAHMFY